MHSVAYPEGECRGLVVKSGGGAGPGHFPPGPGGPGYSYGGDYGYSYGGGGDYGYAYGDEFGYFEAGKGSEGSKKHQYGPGEYHAPGGGNPYIGGPKQHTSNKEG